MVLDIKIIYAEPETAWITDLINEIINKMSGTLFGGVTTWESVVTLFPFITRFEVPYAKEKVTKIRNERALIHKPLFVRDGRTSADILQMYLEKEPIRVMIIGDTRPAFYQIGEQLAKKFSTHHLTPRELIKSHIIRETRIGKWLYYMAKNGKGIPTWVIMKLLEHDLKKDKYEERGYVMTGFPTVVTLEAQLEIAERFEEDREYIVDVPETLDYKLPEEEFIMEDDVESASYCSDSSSICENPTIESELQDEIKDKDFIYISGDDYEEYDTCVRTQLDFIYHLVNRPDYLIYIDTHEYTDLFNVSVSTLQDFVLNFFDENVLFIDYRLGTKNIVQCLINRFNHIKYKVNYNCVPMNISPDSGKTLDELCVYNTVLPGYNWVLSEFGRMCPVNLYFGRRRYCIKLYPTHYLQYVFLCYNHEARKIFSRCPKRFLKLKPCCRVALIGPHRCGKSTFSHYLAQCFDAHIYNDHIQEATEIINRAKPKDDIAKSLLKEYKDLDTQRQQEFVQFTTHKAAEWQTCVIPVMAQIIAIALQKPPPKPGRKSKDSQIMSKKKLLNLAIKTYKQDIDDVEIKEIIKRNAIYNKSLEVVSAGAFIEWLATDSSNFSKQYVLDSAPIDMQFWEDLRQSDALPDCVFFFKVSNVEKMLDIYSFRHNDHCIDENAIFDTLQKIYPEWSTYFYHRDKVNLNRNEFISEPTKQFTPHLVAARLREAYALSKTYENLKDFFEGHNIMCIEIDLAEQTWSKSILTMIYEYLSGFIIKPMPMYNQTITEFVTEVEEGVSTTSASSFTEFDDSRSSLGIVYNTGAFLDWCPVSLVNNNILLKGRKRFTVEYKNKLYVMNSKENFREFLLNPTYYSMAKPIAPPPRVFIIGLYHKHRVDLVDNLAFLLNTESRIYPQNQIPLMQPVYTQSHFFINALRESHNVNKADILLNLESEYMVGGVFFGFPLLLDQFNDAIKRGLRPECVMFFEDQEDVLEVLQNHFRKSVIRVPVPDERYDFLCEYHKPASKVPAYLNVVDIAGLVKGAAEGQGLGNAFLSHISACDAIFHLCRAFEDPDVTHVEGEVDPVRDLDIISEELRLKDEEKLSTNLEKLEKVVARGGDKKLKPEYDSLLKIKTILVDEKKHLRFADWNAHDIEILNKYMFLTTKPVIYLVNLSDKDFIRKKNKWLAKIKEWVDKNDPGATIIPFSGHFEHLIAEKDESERKAYEDEVKCKSVLDKIIVTGYKALQLEYFFTAGPDEVKAWTIQKGTKAPQAAGRIHTDFEKGFIMAEVMHYKDFKEEGSEAAAKAAGKYRQQGRNYVVEDGDIIFFKFNAGAGLKDAKKK